MFAMHPPKAPGAAVLQRPVIFELHLKTSEDFGVLHWGWSIIATLCHMHYKLQPKHGLAWLCVHCEPCNAHGPPGVRVAPCPESTAANLSHMHYKLCTKSWPCTAQCALQLILSHAMLTDLQEFGMSRWGLGMLPIHTL